MNILFMSAKSNFASLLTILAAFFMPVAPLLLTVGLFIAGDTCVGIFRALKKKEKITSRKLSNVVSKMLLYEMTVILFFCLDKFILAGFIATVISVPYFLTKCVAATLCLIEAKSIDESFTEVYGFSVWKRFKGMLRRAKEVKDEF